MLIDELIASCNEKYTEYGDRCGCIECIHPSDKCRKKFTHPSYDILPEHHHLHPVNLRYAEY
jgi:hypothetical protein